MTCEWCGYPDGPPVAPSTGCAHCAPVGLLRRGASVEVRYLDEPARTATVERNGWHSATGVESPDIWIVRFADDSTGQYHRDWLYPTCPACSGFGFESTDPEDSSACLVCNGSGVAR